MDYLNKDENTSSIYNQKDHLQVQMKKLSKIHWVLLMTLLQRQFGFNAEALKLLLRFSQNLLSRDRVWMI
jgi:hypothetical protein